MADTRQSLFGYSPEEVAQAQAAQQQQDAMQWANLPAGRGMVAAAANAGQAFGSLGGKLLGGQDPAQAKAMRMQAAQQDTEARAQAMGIDLATKPQDYYRLAAQTLHGYGLVDEAQNVMNIAQGHDLAERQMRVNEKTVEAKGNRRAYAGKDGTIYDGITGEILHQGSGSTSDKMQSKPGREIADREVLVSKYGEESDQVKSFDKEMEKAKVDPMAKVMAAIDARSALADKNNAAIAERQIAADERRALARENSEVNKNIAEYVDNAGKQASANKQALESVNAAISQIEKSRFEPGFASTFRNKLGEMASYLGYPEITDTINSNSGDAAAMNSSLKQVVADISIGAQGSGDNNRSSKELQFFQDSIGGLGTVEEGLYQALKLRQKQLSQSNAKYDYTLKAASEARKEATAMGDPFQADLILRAKVRDWEKQNPNTITARDWEQFKHAANLMKRAKDAKSINSYMISPTQWKGLKPGMIVVDDDGVVKTFTGKYITYNPGDKWEGRTVKQKVVVPELGVYK